MSKPTVLRLGKVVFAQDKWTECAKIANIVPCESANREQFLTDLKGKYSDITVITRTFQSVAQTGRFDAELAAALPSSVKAICHNGAGYDQIDVAEFTKRGIQVSNVPELVNNSTADTHVFLLLGALRNFYHGHQLMKKGEWAAGAGAAAGAPLGNDPEGKVVGILGMGGIGRAILHRLKPFGFSKFIYHNRNRLPEDQEAGAEYVSFDELLAQSDIVSINVPLNPHTRHMINKEVIGKMKDGVVIVNTARGAVIDEQELISALKSGKVRSAGLDVFENEPQVPQELMDLPNVCIVPHMGTHTQETVKAMEEFVISNAENFITEGKVLTFVPEQKGHSF